MGTYFFFEETLLEHQDGARDVVRYYYEDISEGIVTRSFRLFPNPVRKEFLGNNLMPLADLRPDVKDRLLDFLIKRRGEEGRRQAS